MEYVPIKGFRGGNLIYIPEDRHLYVRRTTKAGRVYFVCYDTVLTKRLKKQEPNFQECGARCTLNESTGLCSKKASCHRDHENHDVIFRDLQSLNTMKDKCRYLAENFPFSARRIPIKEIFLAEMAK